METRGKTRKPVIWAAQNSSNLGLVREKLDASMAELRDEYLADHNHPWVVGFSGGKDSTLLAHLVFEMLLGLAPGDRSRAVHVVSNDTLVESPVLVAHIQKSVDLINESAKKLNLPVVAEITAPKITQTFWVNLIGRGYPAPNRNFRWCTDRMKIQPTSDYIREKAAKTGRTVLLLGVRTQESAARASVVKRHSNGERLHKHGNLKGCMVFRPILDFSTDEVWAILLQRKIAPWGGFHRDLITLYRNAEGGECPTVIDKSDAPSCGSSSARFGCWTCTVVDKDKSLAGLIESGFEGLEPLMNFRDWLVSIRNEPKRRMSVRRNGKAEFGRNGALIPGPFTIETRREILSKLRETEEEAARSLIRNDEVGLIRQIWLEDAGRDLNRRIMALTG